MGQRPVVPREGQRRVHAILVQDTHRNSAGRATERQGLARSSPLRQHGLAAFQVAVLQRDGYYDGVEKGQEPSCVFRGILGKPLGSVKPGPMMMRPTGMCPGEGGTL